MRPLVSDAAVTIQKEASGAILTDIIEDTFTVAASGTSEIANYLFQFSTDFDEDDEKAGLYAPRFFMENMPKRLDLTVQYELAAAAEHGTGALSSGTEMPYLFTMTENFTKATYWADPAKTLKYLKVQFTAGTGATVYDTLMKDREDPRIILDFDRQGTAQLDYDHPNANSDHLFDFSQVDFYIEWPVVIAGTTYTHRHLIGWTADEDSVANINVDTVEFKKGKPMGRVVRFLSELQDEITASQVSMDPWFFKEFAHLFASVSNRQIVLTQKNKQRAIPNYNIVMEWSDNSQHLKRFVMPKAQLWLTGEMTPGGGDISKCAMSIAPLVTANNTTYHLDISQSPIQRVVLPIGFSVTL